MKDNYLNVISLGAGKQSSYMLLNALEGKFEFKPDLAIFADTGCEPKSVYRYFNWLTNHYRKIPIITVQKGNLLQDVLNYVNGNTQRVSQLPFYLENGGIMPRQCTYDYKIAPIRKHLQKIRNGESIRLWIGISLDEMERMKTSNVKYIQNYYPLIENRIAIDNIIEWFQRKNIPTPPKSSCLICPFHSYKYWSLRKNIDDDEFEMVCDFDDRIRNYPKLKNKAYIYRMRKPLRGNNFILQQARLFPELIEECEGYCGL